MAKTKTVPYVEREATRFAKVLKKNQQLITKVRVTVYMITPLGGKVHQTIVTDFNVKEVEDMIEAGKHATKRTTKTARKKDRTDITRRSSWK